MQPPEITYEFYVKDAHAHWSIHSDGIHVTECGSDSGVSVNGIKADQMFMLCRNALSCSREYSVFHELSNKPHNIKAAKEMIESLQSFVNENTATESNDD